MTDIHSPREIVKRMMSQILDEWVGDNDSFSVDFLVDEFLKHFLNETFIFGEGEKSVLFDQALRDSFVVMQYEEMMSTIKIKIFKQWFQKEIMSLRFNKVWIYFPLITLIYFYEDQYWYYFEFTLLSDLNLYEIASEVLRR